MFRSDTVEGETRVPYSASVMSSTRGTETPASHLDQGFLDRALAPPGEDVEIRASPPERQEASLLEEETVLSKSRLPPIYSRPINGQNRIIDFIAFAEIGDRFATRFDHAIIINNNKTTT